jgi:GT2 family glycosyltransferase/glycosyltransferase involved in cell wall biosynthesis
MRFSVIIPVYNAPDVVRALFDSLIAHSDDEHLTEILVGDDGSDTVTAKLLEQFRSIPKFSVLHAVENSGFLETANTLYRRAKSDQIVLLNSDTVVPPRWLSRIADCFNSDPRIALATPLSTNANNVTVYPQRGQSWRDVDTAAMHVEPLYPDAPFAVGFALAIRRTLVGDRLFDPIYGRGYWEDTDLHFSVTDRGYRSVIIDNLLIFHNNGSASFRPAHDLESINEKNRATFLSRWRQEYVEACNRFSVEQPLKNFRDEMNLCCRMEVVGQIDVLFVLPGLLASYGGITVVMRFAERLIEKGVRAAVYALDAVDWAYVRHRGSLCPFQDLDQILKAATIVETVVATHHSTFKAAGDLAKYFGSRLIFLVQGPEVAFNLGKAACYTASAYTKVDEVVVVSECLEHYVESISDRKPTRLHLGPSALLFYPTAKAARDALALAVCLRKESLKGTGLALLNALIAQRAGFRIHLFGDDLDCDFMERAEYHGVLHQRDIAKLMSRVGFYLDCSYMEGLGLLPLEAAYCGAIPIVAELQGLTGILVPDKNCLQLPDRYANSDFFRDLLGRASEGHLETMRTSAESLRRSVSEEKAFAELDSILALRPSNSFELTRYRAEAPVAVSPGPYGEAEPIRFAEQLLKSRSWRVTSGVRQFAAAVRGRQYKEPVPPNTVGEAMVIIETITGSTSWSLAWPMRLCGRLLRRRRKVATLTSLDRHLHRPETN